MVVWTGLLFLDHTGEFKVERVNVQNSQTQKGNLHPRRKSGELTVFKIKAVKVKALHQIPQSLGLERRHGWVAHFPVGCVCVWGGGVPK